MDRDSFLRNAATAIALVLAVAILAAAPVEIAAATQQDSGSPGEPVDINRASVDELIGLPGIGEVMAKRIIEFREQHGPFKRVEDLLKVKGIGEKSFQKLRPSITVSRADSE
jgi:competence protein ComEA